SAAARTTSPRPPRSAAPRRTARTPTRPAAAAPARRSAATLRKPRRDEGLVHDDGLAASLGRLEDDLTQHFLDDAPQPARAEAARDRVRGDRAERAVGQLEREAVEREQVAELAHDRVGRLDEDALELRAVERVELHDHREPSEELGEHPVVEEVPLVD